ncbi:phosphoribosyl-AMP cyclohydrolase [Parvularcula sp. ZS-1/3]|uniref:Phosphoribosyl-AMP cyclohydrolase n=1 Tax=Parvularcula mediterranea TaxID=2732508 RepID=A0A7Y3W5N6_9PROT|nr:phosphoribosyl-AMP cyclohydrolase [Parvularcula mediterranea]NNU16955.1 phosphoribosyl-AMP cyclohydrolase [Parvularcula mediterranea]
MTIEETSAFTPRFNEAGLLPVVAQEAGTGRVLMVAWANREAIDLTLKKGEAHYWSRSRSEMWHKGATSGNVQKVVRVLTDCDQDTLIYEVEQQGPACHTGRETCFYREVTAEGLSAAT